MRKKYFRRRAGIYFCYMMIPTLVIMLCFSFISIQNTIREINVGGEKTIQAVKTNFDLVIDNLMTQNALLTSNPRISLSLKRVLAAEKLSYNDSLNLASLRSILSSMANTHSYIESINLAFEGAPRYFSSETGARSFQYEQAMDWYETYQEMPDSQITTAIVTKTNRQMETFTIIHRLLSQKGCIAIHINCEKLKEMLHIQMANSRELFYLLDTQGKPLITLSSTPDLQSLSNEAILEIRDELEQTPHEGNQRITLGGRAYYFHSCYYQGIGGYMISLIDGSNLWIRAQSLWLSYFYIFLVNLSIVTLLAYITTKRSFDQMELMIDLFDRAQQGLPVVRPTHRAKDEYDVIMNNIMYLYLNNIQLDSEVKDKQFQMEKAELMSLQMQINPHFLFNTLQTLDIQVRTHPEDAMSCSIVIRNVSDILKYALSDPQTPVDVQDEILYLKKYITVQKFRFGDTFVIYYEVDDAAQKAKVFRLMLQPLVENSLLHGLRGLKQRGYIHVIIKKHGDSMYVEVSDTGAGMDEATLDALVEKINSKQSQSIGLTNLHRRLLLRYGESAGLKIKSDKESGTKVFFTFPFADTETEQTIS